jgi:SpoVK/Ycf46/Vps4 family AAA+-type ATPase
MDDAYRVERAIVLFEHLERLVSWAPVGPSFSNSMLQELITAISEPLSSPKGHVLVIATTSKPDVIRRFELEDMFSATLRTRPLSTEEQISFLQSVFEDKPELIADVKSYLPKALPIKVLQTICTAIRATPTAQDFLFNLSRLTKY